jgi:soluble lytic murein transglycosylase-like protein
MASAAAPMTILPQFQGSAIQLQQQQALAQALMQQSFQPQNTQAVGSGQYSIVPKYSAVGGLAQLGQALMAAKMQNNVAQGYNQLGQAQSDYLMGSPTTTQPQQTPDGTSAGAGLGGAGVTPDSLANALGSQSQNGYASPTTQRSGGLLSAGGPLNPNGMDPRAALQMYLDPDGKKELYKSIAAGYAPTAATLQARQGGFDPSQANQRAFAHDTFNAPVTGTGIFRDPYSMKPVAFNPNIPEGGTPLFDASGNVGAINSISNAQNVMRGNAAATSAGEGSVLPYAGVDASGNPLPVTNRTAAATQAGATTPASAAIVQTESGGSPNAVSPKGAMGAWQVMPNTNANPGFGVKPAQNNSPAELNRVGQDYYNAMTQRYQSPTLGAIAYNMGPGATDQWIKNGAKFESLPAETRNYVGKVATLTALNSGAGSPPSGGGAPAAGGAVYAAPPMGAQVNAEKGAGNLQDELSKKFTTLSAANSEAQNTTSYLQNIKDLAARAAVGPQSDRLNYVNGLLSLAGSEKATDAVTANDLLNKYSGQITARLSANGMGTDAARSILQSAYPSAHMNKDAINEAADNLIGAQQMTQAKARLLTPLANARNPTDYNNAEMKFDQNADPRIFQYANIQDPTQRQVFAQKLIKQDPKIVQKIKNLEAMGAMQ